MGQEPWVRIRGGLAACCVAVAAVPAAGQEGTSEPPSSEDADVVYVPTPYSVVERMLELAEVEAEDVVYDLGSGDGRIPIMAAEDYGARGVGLEIRLRLVQQARQNAEEAGVADMVAFRHQDIFEADFSEATAVTLFLLPELNVQLRPMLFEQLAPGTPIVSHKFGMGEWEPERTVVTDGGTTIHKWTVPEEIPAHLASGG